MSRGQDTLNHEEQPTHPKLLGEAPVNVRVSMGELQHMGEPRIIVQHHAECEEYSIE